MGFSRNMVARLKQDVLSSKCLMLSTQKIVMTMWRWFSTIINIAPYIIFNFSKYIIINLLHWTFISIVGLTQADYKINAFDLFLLHKLGTRVRLPRKTDLSPKGRFRPEHPVVSQMNWVWHLVRQPPPQSGASGDSVGGGEWECMFPWMPSGSRVHPEERESDVQSGLCVCACVGSRLNDWGQSRVNAQVWFSCRDENLSACHQLVTGPPLCCTPANWQRIALK